jgi:hypothetical protein
VKITAKPEDAVATYTGDSLVYGDTVLFRATVRDTTDASPGDVTTGTVSFVADGKTLCTAKLGLLGNSPDRCVGQLLGEIFVIVFAIVLGLALACYGAAGSYETIRELADQRGLPLPFLVPVGVDWGLIGAVVLDLPLAGTAQSLGWLRQLSRVLTVGTIVANAVAGPLLRRFRADTAPSQFLIDRLDKFRRGIV